MKSRLLPIVAVLALLATACYGGWRPTETYGTGPAELASFRVDAVPGDQQLAVAWRYATNAGRPKFMHLDLYQVVNGLPVKLASNVIGRTVEPDSYLIPVPAGSWIVRASPEGYDGWGHSRLSPTVQVGNWCPNAALCAHVSPDPSGRPVSLVAQGLLDGGVRDTPLTRALKLRQWRFSGTQSDPAARSLGVSRTQSLSMLWLQTTEPTNGGYTKTPWSDWAAWQSFVQNAVRWTNQAGARPDYWDVWNEPNGTCCPLFSPDDQKTVSVDRWLQTYEIGWRAIKAVDPTAKIIGPSLSALFWAPGASPREFDLDTFLSYSAARGLRWDAVTWHETTVAPSPGDMLAVVTNVDRHVAMARAVLARHPGVVVDNSILINEYGGKAVHLLAGWNVGFFRALEDAGIKEANRACWGQRECGTDLGGLVDPSGRATGAWWIHKLYADLGGGARMRVASTSSWQFDGLATRDDAARAVRVLLGRHWSCAPLVNPQCGNTYNVAPVSAGVTIDWPYGNTPVKVLVDRVPAGIGALTAPVRVVSTTVAPLGGKVTVSVSALSDGDALSIAAWRS